MSFFKKYFYQLDKLEQNKSEGLHGNPYILETQTLGIALSPYHLHSTSARKPHGLRTISKTLGIALSPYHLRSTSARKPYGLRFFSQSLRSLRTDLSRSVPKEPEEKFTRLIYGNVNMHALACSPETVRKINTFM